MTDFSRALSLVAAVISSGCATVLAERAEPPAEHARIAYHPGARPSLAGTVTLRPERIAAGSGIGRLGDVRLYLGGVGSLAGDAATSERVALVFQAARDSADAPVLHGYRRLLLEIDGNLFRSSPLADASLYRYALTELGYTETVLVPIDRPTLERLTSATAVSGRVGDWLSFELTPDDIDELRDFLQVLPQVRRGRPASPTGWRGRRIGP